MASCTPMQFNRRHYAQRVGPSPKYAALNALAEQYAHQSSYPPGHIVEYRTTRSLRVYSRPRQTRTPAFTVTNQIRIRLQEPGFNRSILPGCVDRICVPNRLAPYIESCWLIETAQRGLGIAIGLTPLIRTIRLVNAQDNSSPRRRETA